MELIPVHIAVLSISDPHSASPEAAGQLVADRMTEVGHSVIDREIIEDGPADIRAQLDTWLANPEIDVVIAIGGSDVEAVFQSLGSRVTKRLRAFAETFRIAAYEEIGSAAMLVEADAAQCGHTFIFWLPASVGAVRTALESILIPQFDHRTKPRNLVAMMARLQKPDEPDVPFTPPQRLATPLPSQPPAYTPPKRAATPLPIAPPIPLSKPPKPPPPSQKLPTAVPTPVAPEKTSKGMPGALRPPSGAAQPVPVTSPTDDATTKTETPKPTTNRDELPEAPDASPPPSQALPVLQPTSGGDLVDETTGPGLLGTVDLESLSRAIGEPRLDDGGFGPALPAVSANEPPTFIGETYRVKKQPRRTWLWIVAAGGLMLAMSIATIAIVRLKTKQDVAAVATPTTKKVTPSKPQAPKPEVVVQAPEPEPAAEIEIDPEPDTATPPAPEPPKQPPPVTRTPTRKAPVPKPRPSSARKKVGGAATPPKPTAPEPGEKTIAELPASAPAGGDCDEVSCVLERYKRDCCQRWKPKDEVKAPPAGGPPEDLDRSMIQAGVGPRKPVVIRCGEKTSAKGTVKVTLSVSPSGTVDDVTVKESPDPALGECVAAALRKAKFGQTQNGGTFTYPFVF